MKFKVIEMKDNPVFKRKEIVLEIKHAGEATPTREMVKNFVTSELDLNTEHIFIISIRTETGRPISRATVYAFNSLEDARLQLPRRLWAKELS
ncbi:TPA: 30S ribosomal protein S24e [Candidatus Micrarchaeota archaeon]|nr:30S ribosomal protein S24e [Candidatus Micrarchaeota archaeon]